MSKPLRLHAAPGGVYVIAENEQGVIIAAGDTVPSDAALGYAPGCQFFQLDGSTEATYRYVNIGTKASADFDAIDLNVSEAALLSGILATSAEINRATDLSTRIVDCTASSLALTLADHDGKTVTLNRAAGIAVTLPAATGTGARFKLFIGTTITTTSTTTITRAGSDTIFGQIFQLADGGATLAAYELPGSTVITLGTSSNTTGGTKGDTIYLEDVAAATWHCLGYTTAAGSEATPVT